MRHKAYRKFEDIYIRGLEEVSTQFYPYLTQGHILIEKRLALTLKNISYRLNDIYSLPQNAGKRK